MALEFVQNKENRRRINVKLACLTTTVLALTACGGGSGGNNAPSLSQASLSITTLEDNTATGTVVASDSDGDTLGFSVGTSPSNGSLTVSQDGSFVYTPSADFFGEDAASITVSDSIESVSASISFTVTNVNDLPVIQTSSLVVGSNGETTGIIEATDVDGDTLTFTVNAQPEQGVVDIDSATGAFTFVANELATVDDSFVVSVSDGIGEPVLGTIDLGASYVSNEDKLTYYYASSHSHITNAENMVVRDGTNDVFVITDAEVAEDAYINIAVGYAVAGFADLSIQTINEKVITRSGKAEALRLSANELERIGESNTARTFRTEAVVQKNAYIAELGLDNLSTSDATFYRKLVEDYIDADDFDSAVVVLNITRAYAEELSDLTQARTSAHGKFGVLATDLLASRVEAYALQQSDLNYESVITALDYAIHIADTTSFNTVRGNNNFTSRTLLLVEATRYAYAASLIGSDEQKAELTHRAKTSLARGISMYVTADYDDAYRVDVADYAEETLSRYPTGLGNLTGPFAALYPDYIAANSTETAIGNLPLMLVEEEEGSTDLDTKKAYRDHYAYSIVSSAFNGEDITPLIEALTHTFTVTYTDTEYVVEALVEQDDAGFLDKRAAWFLHYSGLNAEARQMTTAAIDVLSTQAYFDDVGYNVDKLVENYGCSRFVELYAEFGGDNETRNTLYGKCLDIVALYFGEDSQASELQKMNAFINAAFIQRALGNEEGMQSAISAAQANVEALAGDDEDLSSLFEYRIYIANAFASLGELETAASMFSTIADQAVEAVSSTATIEDKVNAVDDILGELEAVFEPDYSNAFLNIDNLLFATKKHAGLNEEYAQAISSIKATGAALLESLLAATSEFADSENVDFYESFIEQYAWLGNYEDAQSLSVNEIYTTADSEALFAVIAETMATQDDFPASAIANVDTDNDGLPNFFLLNATEDAISESGLSTDNDADNDGIEDPNDLNPLDKD
ncbi:cadherin-like domain-containing protein [Alteromonas macleodii]